MDRVSIPWTSMKAPDGSVIRCCQYFGVVTPWLMLASRFGRCAEWSGALGQRKIGGTAFMNNATSKNAFWAVCVPGSGQFPTSELYDQVTGDW